MDGLLGDRIRKVLSGKEAITYYDEHHAGRLRLYCHGLDSHHWGGTKNSRLAVMYLLTATEPLRRWGAPNLLGFWPPPLREWKILHGLSGQEYALYQAARGLHCRRKTITIPELCDEDLVDDLTLALILDALLIDHYGPVILRLEETGGEKDAGCIE